jgi:DNA-3-methyladenine glycosylase
VEDDGVIVPDAEVVQSVRVGVDYAGEWALKPWRWMWSRPVQSKLEKVRERRVAVRVGAK